MLDESGNRIKSSIQLKYNKIEKLNTIYSSFISKLINTTFYLRFYAIENERFKSHYKETELRKGDDHPNFVHAFNAYAPAGTITGQLVYVNYGRGDFRKGVMAYFFLIG